MRREPILADLSKQDLSTKPRPLPWLRVVADRFLGQLPLLALFGVVLAVLVVLGHLPLSWAALSLAAVVAGALAMPAGMTAAPPEVQVEAAEVGEPAGQIAFADALVDPCFMLDRRGVVIHANAAAARRFPAVAPGRLITLALRDPEFVRSIDAVLRKGESRQLELHETVPTETWEQVLVAPLRRPGTDWMKDEQRRVILTFQSLTELKRVDALRTDFVANASHELRTPLASLMGFIDTLLGPAARDAEARAKFLGIMRGQAERMSRLIDDLLSLSRIEMHQHLRPTDSVDLAALLREVRDGLQTQARAAELEVVLSLPEGSVPVTADRAELYEVFENLLDNAIKYGAGGLTVEVGLGPSDRAGFEHRVTVIDHGPGVEPEHVPRLTERFYRIDEEASRKRKGTGLGLAIVKHIVHRHRGELTIRSRPGEGMRVDVYLQ